MDKKGKLTEGTLLAISMWALGHYFAMGVSNAYYSYFLTNIIFMPAEDMGTIMFLVRTISVIIVPFLANYFQNHSLPYGKNFGKYRTMIFTFVPLVAITGVLTFIPFTNLSRFGALAYYFVTYFLFYTFYGFPQICYQTMMPRIGNEYDAPRVTGHRAIFSSSAALIYSFTCMPMVYFFGKGDMGKGYMITLIVYSLAYIVFCVISGLAYKEADYYPGDVETKKEQTKLSAAQQWKAFKSKPFLIAFFGDLFKNIGYFFFTGTTTYYFTYIIGDLSAVTLYLTLLNGSGILAAFIIGPMSAKIGLRNSYVVCYGGMSLGLILTFFFGQNLIMFYIFTIIFRIAYGFSYSIGLLSYVWAANIYEAETGEDTISWMMTMYGMPLGLGAALTSGVVGWVLGSAGFDATLATQSSTVLLWIRLMTTLIPGVICLIAFALWVWVYPIKTNEQYEQTLERLRAAKN